MIKLSKMTDYAVVILAEMASEDQRFSASTLSAQTKLPEPTVSKILKQLARQNLISSTRGVNGGYALEQNPDELDMASIIAAMEGPIALTACVEASEECCEHASHCTIKGQWHPVNVAMQKALANVSLKEMMKAGR